MNDFPSRPGLAVVAAQIVIVGALLACLTLGLSELGRQIAPDWRADYLPFAGLVVALEAALSTRLLHAAAAARQLPLPWYVLRAAEAAGLFLAARLLLTVWRGPGFVVAHDSFYGGIDRELFGLTLIAGVIWLLGWRLTRLLIDLNADIAAEHELLRETEDVRVTAWQSLAAWLLLMGLGLVGVAALARVRAPSDTSVGYVLAYFGLALLLLSQTRFTLLRAAWQSERIPFDRGVGRRWLLYSGLLLGGLALAALALPTQYALGLFATLQYLLTLLGAVVQLIVFVVVLIVAYILSVFFPEVQLPAAPRLPLPPAGGPVTAPTGLSPLLEFIQSALFWGLFLGVAGYLLRQYLLRKPQAVNALRRLPGLSLIVRLWRQLRSFFGGLGDRLDDLRAARRQARSFPAARTATAPRRWLRLQALSPRQRVQFYYGALLRRGAEHGLPRAPAQTPYEYARTLRERRPEADEDLAGLTAEFLEARYTAHAISAARAGRAQHYWQRLKRLFRR